MKVRFNFQISFLILFSLVYFVQCKGDPLDFSTDKNPAKNPLPVIEILNPALDSERVNGPIVYTVMGTASDDSAVNTVEISIDGGAWSAVTGTATWTYDLTLPGTTTAGPHTISVRATDDEGGVSTLDRTIRYVDLLTPTDADFVFVTLAAPAATPVTGESVTFNAEGVVSATLLHVAVTAGSVVIKNAASATIGTDSVTPGSISGSGIDATAAHSIDYSTGAITFKLTNLSDTYTIDYTYRDGTKTMPFTTIQPAIDYAYVTSKHVCVAEGIYGGSSNNTLRTFITMKSGVSVYGGYDTDIATLWMRNIPTNLTTIADTSLTVDTTNEKEESPVTAVLFDNASDPVENFTSTLDGFTINGASVASSYKCAINCVGKGKVIISNNTINSGSSITAGRAWAIRCYADADPVLIYKNTIAGSTNASAIWSCGIEATRTNVRIIENTINSGVAIKNYAIYCIKDYPYIYNNIISSGATGTNVYGIVCSQDSYATVSTNTINGLTATNSSNYYGIYINDNSDPEITTNTITITGGGTTSTKYGIYCILESNPTITGNEISGTTATTYYGMYFEDKCNPEITGNTINGSTSGTTSYGINCYNNCMAEITGNTINNITATTKYGIYLRHGSSPVINTNIFNSTNATNSTAIYEANYVAGSIDYSDPQTVTNNQFTGTWTTLYRDYSAVTAAPGWSCSTAVAEDIDITTANVNNLDNADVWTSGGLPNAGETSGNY